MKSIAQEHDCLLIDLDGTVFCGRQPTGGAVQSLSQVRSRKLFVTNNASRSADEVAAHLCELGFTATGEDVVTSAQTRCPPAGRPAGAGCAGAHRRHRGVGQRSRRGRIASGTTL